jgi:large subunit ribosomal protein L25
LSNEVISLETKKRTVTGKAVKTLRRNGIIPANMYERGHDSVAIEVPHITVQKVFEQAGKHHPVELLVEGKKHMAMIKDVDVDPVTGIIRHVAFHAIKMDEKVNAEIPVVIEGDAPAERASHMVLHPLDVVEVEALPANLPDQLVADGTQLVEIGDRLTVGDLKVPEGVTILTDPDQVIATVEEQRVQEVEAPVTEEIEGDAANEVPSDHGSAEEEQAA